MRFAPMACGPLLASILVVLSPMAQSHAQSLQEKRAAIERPGRTGLPLPRFVSLRANEVNLRTGPGVRYPIDWVYKRRNLPVEIIDEYETWRRIRDWEGTIGWVHQSMLKGTRNVLFTGEARDLRRQPELLAPPVAKVEPGVVGRLETCEDEWCKVAVAGVSGWLRRHEFFGVYPREKIR